MKITVKGEPFDLDAGSLTNKELMDLERATGMTFGEWQEALGKMSMLAVTGAVWLVLRKSNPKLKFDDVEFNFEDFKVEGDVVDPTAAGPRPGRTGTSSPSSTTSASSRGTGGGSRKGKRSGSKGPATI